MWREKEERVAQEVPKYLTQGEDKQGSEKLFYFAVETITFWAKRLSFMPKSSFSGAYE